MRDFITATVGLAKIERLRQKHRRDPQQLHDADGDLRPGLLARQRLLRAVPSVPAAVVRGAQRRDEDEDSVVSHEHQQDHFRQQPRRHRRVQEGMRRDRIPAGRTQPLGQNVAPSHPGSSQRPPRSKRTRSSSGLCRPKRRRTAASLDLLPGWKVGETDKKNWRT
jgi:hypothetical protein